MKHISSKELNYINDLLSSELLSAKKCYQYGHQETNPTHQQNFFDAALAHQQNYQSILNYITNFNNQQGGQTH